MLLVFDPLRLLTMARQPKFMRRKAYPQWETTKNKKNEAKRNIKMYNKEEFLKSFVRQKKERKNGALQRDRLVRSET